MTEGFDILVIDDDPQVCRLVSRVLSRPGRTVTAAQDGRAGLSLLSERRFDLVLCDIGLPGMGGIDALEAVKRKDPSIEVVMITGRATVEEAVSCMKKGAYDFLTKPFGPEILEAAARRALDHAGLSREVAQLRELNNLKSDFLSNMSHELRTPLAVALGYVSLLLEGGFGPVPEKQTEALSRIDENGRRLIRLINNVLDYSALSTGKMAVVPERFGLRPWLEETVGALEPLAAGKGLALRWEVDRDMTARTDRTMLQQILTNLVDNAVKFTDQGGVTVSTSDAGEGRLEVAVRDTGVGIDDKDLALIFEEFRQADGTATRRHGGMGLGLAIGRKLARLLNGDITVESAPGQGSTFRVVVPSELESLEPAAGLAVSPGPARVRSCAFAPRVEAGGGLGIKAGLSRG